MKEIFRLLKSVPLSSNATSTDLANFWNAIFNELEGGKSLSSIEQQDRALKQDRFLACSSSDYPNIIDNLFKDSSSPKAFVIVVAASAIRCTCIIRQLESVKRNGKKIAKLFGKHLKLDEQRSFLARNSPSIGVGTPARIAQLVDELCPSDGEIFLLVDSAFRGEDAKQRTIWEVRETRKDLFALVDVLPLQTKLIFV